ncbi:unnamed protein product [Thelazia callipaeda]|uniref:Ubiquinol-cytochrome c reductase complex 9.5 kDa protein n=1 Tax=Thelazia callipaeda TaxID=103827 RepID=A0A0N5D3I2_THECL|nr:unnamed protein product [Thelazia callipaeda]
MSYDYCFFHFFRIVLRLPTYGAFGVGAVLALVYMTDWETVGRHIPIWKYHFDDPVTVKNDTTDETSSST